MRRVGETAVATLAVAGGVAGFMWARMLDQNGRADAATDLASLELCMDGQKDMERGEDGILRCARVIIQETVGVVREGQPIEIDWQATEAPIKNAIEHPVTLFGAGIADNLVMGGAAAFGTGGVAGGVVLNKIRRRSRVHGQEAATA